MKTPSTEATAAPLIPPQPTIEKLQRAARDCRACPLWKTGTQTVFGSGAARARVVFVGEQIAACRPWLEAELEVLKLKVLVCLGATAAQALIGKEFKVSQQRGKLVQSNLAPNVMATVHPSSILRAPDDESRHAEMEKFIADLKEVAAVIHGLAP
jgi:DNA polymerase